MQLIIQFPVILLHDLDVTWWRNQSTLTANVMSYRFNRERALNVAENVGIAFLYGTYIQGGRLFELILTVKIKTRHPV